MVLSNRKLKQKLRSLVAESLAAAESQKANEDVNRQLQIIRELMDCNKSPRPKSSKRPKRKKKPPSPKESKPVEGVEETHKEKGEDNVLITSNAKEKCKKRKREGDGGQESTEKKKKLKKKKLKKKKDKKKMMKSEGEKEGKKNEEENGAVDEVSKEEGVVESIKIIERKVMKSEGEKEGKKNEKENGAVDEVSKEEGVAELIKIIESEQNAKKVYVGGIPYYSTEDDIRSFFEGCGTITEIDCMRFPESGKFRGIAILTFKTEAAAKRALALDGADMGGFYLKIQPYKAKGPHKSDSDNHIQKSDFAPEIVEGYNRIYVGNLSWDITEDDLRKLFSDCNTSSVRFGEDKATGEFRGYAHVDFSDSASLTAALRLDQEVVCGRPVRIRCAVPKRAAETKVGMEPDVKKLEDDGIAGNSKKKKRRTCYECGVPGHLSSDCPRRRAVGTDDSVENS